MDKSQRRQSECDAVRHSECGDGFDQTHCPPGDHQQREHEEQVVDAQKNVLHAELRVLAGDLPCTLLHGYRGGGI